MTPYNTAIIAQIISNPQSVQLLIRQAVVKRFSLDKLASWNPQDQPETGWNRNIPRRLLHGVSPSCCTQSSQLIFSVSTTINSSQLQELPAIRSGNEQNGWKWMNMERLERNGRTRKVPLNASSFWRPAKQATTKSLAGLACKVWGLVLSAYLDVADKNLHLEICWIRRAVTSLSWT